MPDVVGFRIPVAGLAAYPDPPTPNRIEVETRDWPTVSVQFERDYAQAWPKASARNPRRFRLTYQHIPVASLDIIRNHFTNATGPVGAFVFTLKTTGEKLRARYAEPILEWTYVDKAAVYSLAVLLEEVMV